MSTSETTQASPSHLGFWRRFLRKRLAVGAAAYLVLIVALVLLAGVISPYAPTDQDLLHPLSPPSADHWLGTGELGRDVFSRLLHGGRVTLLGVLISVGVFAVIGIASGLVAGYRGGWVDRFVLRAADVVYAVPVTIVMLVVLAIFPNDETIAMVALGLLGAPGLARVVRSVTMGLREELYVRAARASGLTDGVILRRHVLPGLSGPIIVQISLFGAAAVGLETALGFLGLGVQQATWGSMVAEASRNIGTQPWLLVPSGALIISFILALGLVGDGARDASVEHGTPRRRARRAAAPVPAPATAPDDSALLSVRGLVVSFDVDGVETTVVQDVDLDVHRGEVLGIVGESGCGKTVTASAVIGLLREGGRIAGGSVRFDGTELTTASASHLRTIRGGSIGWISQDPMSSLDPSFTAGSQIAEAIRAHRSCSRREARSRALELLAEVRLPDPARTARSYPHQLSGGMAQRVGIALALACDPDLVIADEPTTALDVTVQAEILDLLRAMGESGRAVVLITHDWGVLADVCRTAVVMYAGQVVETASVEEIIHAPRHPYTAALLRSNPHHATPGQLLPVIEGTVPAPSQWPLGCHFAARCALATDTCRSAPVALVDIGPDRLTRCVHHDHADLIQREEVLHG
ncbi:MAG: dipeptide/oligopeptide/nickel ABC transporter permease/ATP-binding protein [Aeromicrobium sp.]